MINLARESHDFSIYHDNARNGSRIKEIDGCGVVSSLNTSFSKHEKSTERPVSAIPFKEIDLNKGFWSNPESVKLNFESDEVLSSSSEVEESVKLTKHTVNSLGNNDSQFYKNSDTNILTSRIKNNENWVLLDSFSELI